MKHDEICVVLINCANSQEARAIAGTLVAERLAAAANVLAPATSFYRWDGELRQAEEVPLLLKTQRALFDRLTERIRALHSYDCPGVLALPAVAGATDYLHWIAEHSG